MPAEHVVLVTGGRDFIDQGYVDATLDALDPKPTAIVEGGATGADLCARRWCIRRGVDLVEVPALWKALGRRAGHRRNGRMIDLLPVALVVAFPGGRGTMNMVGEAKRRGVKVLDLRW